MSGPVLSPTGGGDGSMRHSAFENPNGQSELRGRSPDMVAAAKVATVDVIMKPMR